MFIVVMVLQVKIAEIGCMVAISDIYAIVLIFCIYLPNMLDNCIAKFRVRSFIISGVIKQSLLTEQSVVR